MSALPLNQLAQWDGNVRKTNVDEGIDELAASIASHGLLSALTVKQGKKGGYVVIAGQRRLKALQALVKSGQIDRTAPIDCTILSPDTDATEASLAENVVRTAMHPADQFDAWRALADKGSSPAEIAARFGAAESTVIKRLKLGRVSPVIMQSYRDGKIGLDSVEAFTVTDDHAEQERVLAGRTNWFGPSDIRRALTQGEIPATDKRVKFVGLDAYEAAGGSVRRDLFDRGNAGWVSDAVLLEKLLQEKLDGIAEDIRSEGWKWVEVRPEFHQYSSEYHKEFASCERGKVAPLSPEEKAERDQLTEESDALAKFEEETGESSDEKHARFKEIEARLDTLGKRPAVFSKAVIKRAGAVVTLGYNGLEIVRGLVKNSDAPKMEGAKPDAAAETAKSPYSQALRESLTKEITGAMQGELCIRPHMALVALLHSQFTNYGSPVHVTFTQQSCPKDSPASAVAVEALDACIPESINRFNHQLVWDWLFALPDERLLELLAAKLAPTISAAERASNVVRKAQSLDLRKWFTPDAENYFGKVSKDQVLCDLAEMGVTGAELKACGSMKKGELAKAAAKVAAERAPDWLPVPMRMIEQAQVSDDEDDDME